MFASVRFTIKVLRGKTQKCISSEPINFSLIWA